MIPARSFFRWAGGKRWLGSVWPDRPPGWSGGYVAPFLGGGALFFVVAEDPRFKRAVLSDSNPVLIGLYRSVQTDPGGLLARLELHAEEHDRDPEGYYRATRRAFNDAIRPAGLFNTPRPGSLQAGADFLYLNATCFSGLFRLNGRGEFNVSRDPAKTGAHIFNPKRVELVASVHQLLARADVRFEVRDYAAVYADAEPGDLLYADPPYDETFDQYAAKGFSAGDQRQLSGCLHRCADHGVFVMASNSNTPLIRTLYRDWLITEHLRPGTISVGDRAPVPELLVTSWRP